MKEPFFRSVPWRSLAVISVCVVLLVSCFVLLTGTISKGNNPDERVASLIPAGYSSCLNKLGIPVMEDYGGFQLIKLTAGQAHVLTDNGIDVTPYPDSNVISLGYATFDVRNGQPAIPSNLKIDSYPNGVQGMYIVQMMGPVKESWKALMSSYGAHVGDYLPNDAFMVQMDNSVRSKVENLPFVQWTGIFQPAYKISGELTNAVGTKTVTVITTPSDMQSVASTIGKLGGSLMSRDVNSAYGMIRAHIDASLIDTLAMMNDVTWIEPYHHPEIYNVDAQWITQSDVSNSRPIWDKGIHGEGQIVGHADTGLDYANDFFKDPNVSAPGPTHRKVLAYLNYADNKDYSGGHGTHTEGTLDGDDGPAGGTNTNDGMAPKAKTVFQDIANSSTIINLGDLANNIFTPSYAYGARVHSDSWGSNSAAYDADARSVDVFMWGHKDFLICFANGNAGPSSGTVGTPATAKDCISVGCVQTATPDSISSFSSRGPSADGRQKPTLTGPGDPLDSASAGTTDGTTSMSGTSMATPAVAGSMLLERQYYTEGWYPTGTKNAGNAITPSAALLKATAIASAMPMTSISTWPGEDQGYGRLCLANALYFTGNAKNLFINDDSTGLSTGGSYSTDINVTAGQPLKVVLVWTDYYAALNANPALVNNLDLNVTAGASVYKGNVFSGGQSTTGGTADSLNVEEVVYLKAPTTGTYNIKVQGTNVPQGPQPFALVVTGNVSGGTPSNRAPNTPTTPTGPTTGSAGQPYSYSTATTDPDGDQVKYTFNWGDGSTFSNTSLINSGTTGSASHTFATAGVFNVSAMATDSKGATSGWSGKLMVTMTSNSPPATPATPTGTTNGWTGTAYTYSTSATDPDGDQVKYTFDWGDSTAQTTTSLVNSGTVGSAQHTYTTAGNYNVKAMATDSKSATSGWSGNLAVKMTTNSPPGTPSTPSGPTSGVTGTTYHYNTSATDPNGDQVKYTFDWGDSSTQTTTGLVNSGTVAGMTHSWTSTGNFVVKAMATDNNSATSAWSAGLTVSISNPDTTPPVITHTPVTTAQAGNPIPITATITDDRQVASATLYYESVGATTFSSLAMTASGSTYSVAIPAQTKPGTVGYYIEATDGTNTVTHPATNPTTSPHQITITSVGALNVTVTSSVGTMDVTQTAKITVTVTSGVSSMAGATVTLTSDNGGSFSTVSDKGGGSYESTFTPPTIAATCKITATAAQSGYASGSASTNIVVILKVSALAVIISSNSTTITAGDSELITIEVKAGAAEMTGAVVTVACIVGTGGATTEKGGGIYEFTYSAPSDASGQVTLTVTAIKLGYQMGTNNYTLTINKKQAQVQFVFGNMYFMLALLLIVIIVIAIVAAIAMKRRKKTEPQYVMPPQQYPPPGGMQMAPRPPPNQQYPPPPPHPIV